MAVFFQDHMSSSFTNSTVEMVTVSGTTPSSTDTYIWELFVPDERSVGAFAHIVAFGEISGYLVRAGRCLHEGGTIVMGNNTTESSQEIFTDITTDVQGATAEAYFNVDSFNRRLRLRVDNNSGEGPVNWVAHIMYVMSE